MKKNLIPFLLFMCIILADRLYAQDSTVHTVNLSNTDVTENRLRPQLSEIGGNSLTSKATLNVFFANKVSTYLSEASDLSLSRSYAVLDNSDGRLFLGGTFNAKKDNREFQRFLFTAGVKANVKDGFANLFGSGKINNDIGLSLKGTIFGRGIIWFDKDPKTQKNKVQRKRVQIVNELLSDFDRDLTKYRNNLTGLSDSEDDVKNYISEYEEEMATKLAEKESDFIIKKKLFNLAHTWWVSFDLYLPVTESSYKTVADFSTTSVKNTAYRPYELNVIYSNLWEKNKREGGTIFGKGVTLLTFKGSLIANNSVNASLIDSYSFDKYLTQTSVVDTLFLAKLKSNSVYVGNFEQFITPRLSGRFVYMPFQFIGLSAAFEKSFGKVDDLNWRLGIPVSLKDKEGKSKINFEVVWREIGKDHSFGLSVGLPIGATIF